MTISLNPTENLFDSQLNKKNYSSISLSIQLSLNHLTYTIIDNSQNKFLAIVNYTFSEKVSPFTLTDFLHKLFEHETFFKKDYKEIIISYDCNQSTLIPEEIFDEKHSHSYLEFLNPELNDEVIISNYISDFKLFSIFALPKCIFDVFNNNLKKFKIIHNSNSFFQSIFLNFSKIDNINNTVFVDVESHSFEIVVFKNNKLIIDNTFQFKTKEDFLYYLLFVLKQLNIEPLQIQLILSGKITANSSVFNLLTKYISKVTLNENKTDYTFSEVLSDINYHQYFKLLNQIKCV